MNEQKYTEPTGGEEEAASETRKRLLHELLPLQVASVCAGVAAIVLLSLVAQLFLIQMIKSFAPQLAGQAWFSVAAASVPMYLVAMPLSYFVFRFGRSFAPKEKRGLSVVTVLGLAALSFGVAMLGNWIGTAVQAAISAVTGGEVINPVVQATESTPFWANLLFLGILAPIAEEIVYRKLVIDRLRPLGVPVAVIFSGLLFGLIHGNFSQFFYATMFGIVAGVVYTQTGKLRYSIALHMAVNLVSGVFSAEILRAMGAEEHAFLGRSLAVNLYYAYAYLMLACVVLVPILILCWRNRIASFWKSAESAPTGVVGLLIRQPAVWVLVALTVLLFWI